MPRPPSTGISAPEVKVASNPRNSTARVTSAIVPWRPMGVASSPSRTNAARPSSVSPETPMDGVSTKPGATAFTRIRRGSSSEASTRAKPRTAAFVPVYTLIPAVPPALVTDVVNTIDPPSAISGRSRCTVKNAPRALTANIRS